VRFAIATIRISDEYRSHPASQVNWERGKAGGSLNSPFFLRAGTSLLFM
jgi:hypothetical protein